MSERGAPLVLRSMQASDAEAVAALIRDSTNAWYRNHGFAEIFPADTLATRLFFDVYEALDPGCGLVVEDPEAGRLAGSCFFHPRATHVSLGIMNAHADYFGRGVARRLLNDILTRADTRGLPVRLVSSAMNLDSFSLYNRAGFVPQAFYQDMLLSVPENGLSIDINDGGARVRSARVEDVPRIVRLEQEQMGIARPQDFAMFVENSLGCWHLSVAESPGGDLLGYTASILHEASRMVGPGWARNDAIAVQLLGHELQRFVGTSVVVLVPSTSVTLSHTFYGWGARNCELHIAQVRGKSGPQRGVFWPTFMPESA